MILTNSLMSMIHLVFDSFFLPYFIPLSNHLKINLSPFSSESLYDPDLWSDHDQSIDSNRYLINMDDIPDEESQWRSTVSRPWYK